MTIPGSHKTFSTVSFQYHNDTDIILVTILFNANWYQVC